TRTAGPATSIRRPGRGSRRPSSIAATARRPSAASWGRTSSALPSACGSDALPLTVGAVAVESGADLLIRAAQANDVRRIAQIHVRAWQWAYPDPLPAAFLARLSVVRRATYWRRWLAEAAPHRQLWLVSRDMRRIGFAATGPSRDADGDPSTGEIHALYL